MKVADHMVYFQHFKKKDQTMKILFAGIAGIFAIVLWFRLLIVPMGAKFGDLITETTRENGTTVSQIGNGGVLFGLWFLPIALAFFIFFIRFVYMALILRDIKQQEKLTWLESIFGMRYADKGDYNDFALALSICLSAIGIPLLYLIPVELSASVRWFALFFLTFLTLSTYGLRNERLNKRWEKQEQKERQKNIKKEQSKPTTQAIPSIEQLIQQAYKEKEYKLPYFQEERTNIIEEIRLFDAYSEKTTVEDVHLIERILKEEIPAVLVTYDELDAEGKREYQAKLHACLEKIHHKLIQRNKGKQEIKKLGAQKVIEILEKRY